MNTFVYTVNQQGFAPAASQRFDDENERILEFCRAWRSAEEVSRHIATNRMRTQNRLLYLAREGKLEMKTEFVKAMKTRYLFRRNGK